MNGKKQALLDNKNTTKKTMKNQTKLSELQKRRDELHKYIKELKFVILGEMGTLYDRWSGYKILMESYCEAESKDWHGTEDNEYRMITGEHIEIWQAIAENNADYMKKAALKHAKRAMIADEKLRTAEKELKQNWKEICKEEAKKEQIYDA